MFNYSPDVVFRDFVTDGVPTSGKWDPRKPDIRDMLAERDAVLEAGLSNGGLIYDTKANMDADLAHGANSSAWVVADSTVANNGIYRKSGASGSGSWTRIADLPYSFIRATDAGAGTADAIVATTSIPLPANDAATLIALNIYRNNTGAATVAFNGGSPLTIKTTTGADVQADYLVAGAIVAGYVSGSTFRLISDVGTSAAAAAAQAAADEAAGYAAGLNLPAVDISDAGKALVVKSDGSGYVTAGIREKLLANRTYYVRTDGNDGNDGLTNNSGGAFLTIQKAVDTVYKATDLNGYAVTISVADGTYTGAVSLAGKPLSGGGTLTITGNTTTPSNCFVNVTASNAFNITGGAVVSLSGFKVATTTSGHGVNVATGGTVTLGAMNYGACAEMHINCGSGGVVSLAASYTISGGAQAHWHCGAFGDIRSSSAITVTLTGTPAFSVYFCGVAQGTVYVATVTFSGSATGQRYIVHYNGFIAGGGTDETFFPGDSAGSASVGGVYQCITVGGTNVGGYQLRPENYANNYLTLESKNFNANTWNVHFKVQNALVTGKGWVYVNGDGSYLSGATYLSGDAQVAVGSGTVDGVSFSGKATVAAGGIPVLASSNGAAVASLRRRSSDGGVVIFYRDTTPVGSISVTGSATAFNTSSDYRLKKDDKPIRNAAEILSKLRPVEFAWKATGKRVTGFFAHEVADVLPEAVTGDKDAVEVIGNASGPEGELLEAITKEQAPEDWTWTKTGKRPVYQAIDQAKLVPLLTAALQEALQRIEALEAR